MKYATHVEMFQGALEEVRKKISCTFPVGVGRIPDVDEGDAVSSTRWAWREDLKRHVPLDIIISEAYVWACYTDTSGIDSFRALKLAIFWELASLNPHEDHVRLESHRGKDFIQIFSFRTYEEFRLRPHPDLSAPIPRLPKPIKYP